jgi:hypothetical protein
MNWYLRTLTVMVLCTTLAACGGGGGGSDRGESSPIAPSGSGSTSSQSYDSALNFESPDAFLNGQPHTTTLAVITVSGELNSVTVPRGYCPGSPPQNHKVRWTNRATGDTDTVRVSIGCVTNNLFGEIKHGVASVFDAEGIGLTLGQNTVLFETFDDGSKVGEDTIVIIREDRTAPAVTYRYPNPEASDVPSNHPILMIFSEPMDPASLSADHFALTDANNNPVYGELVYDEQHYAWGLQPDQPLTPGEQYTVTVSADVQDAGGANLLGEPLSWAFVVADVVDQTAPELLQHWPGPTCDCAPSTTRILTRFDEPILPGSVDASSIEVRDNFDQPLAGTTVYAGDYLEFVPETELQPGATYQVSAVAGLQDLVGQASTQTVTWQFNVDARTPAGSWWGMAEDMQVPAMSGHTAVWADPEVLFWGGTEGAAYNVGLDTWTLLPHEGAPSSRVDHSAVWTGSEMFVWGGRANGIALASGARYNPVTADWVPVQPPSAPEYQPGYRHVAVWTGDELVVWGGYTAADADDPPVLVNRGWRYDPMSDSWTTMSAEGAPSARHEPVAEWSGTELLIWGGKDADGNLMEDGARYNPETDAWTPITRLSAPRSNGHPPAGTWTGSELIVWNGGALYAGQRSNTGYRQPTLHLYDPATDRWRVSESGWEPLLITRSIDDEPLDASLHWAGDRLIALGGWSFAGIWAYDPSSDSWRELNRNGGRFGYRGEAEIWAGDRLVRWGGVISVLPSRSGKVLVP